MFHQSDALREKAAKYLRLARGAQDPRARSKFFDYAMIYAQLSEQSERRETSRGVAGKIWSAEMLPNEETSSYDITVDDAASKLRVVADLLAKSAAANADKEKREALLDYAKLYREMAELRDQSDAEVDDEPA